MRFIDADKLIKEMLKPCPFVLDTTQYDNIYGIPIVEAIPVEWIERKIKENLYDRYASWEDIAAYVDTDTMMKAWAILIDRWEKENEVG